jgi:GrpB-like predicted nucleotidyltransferase (UPF0157 family)
VPQFKDSIAAGGFVVKSSKNRAPEPIELVAYDPRWVDAFQRMRKRLADALGETALRIEHVGSTAIPGIPAKPVVDIQVSVPDIDDDEAFRAPIEAQGFELRFIEPGHRYFRPPPGVARDYQVHVCQIGSDWERVHLLFRDYLRTHPDVANEYGRMKLRLAGQHGQERIAYNDDKGPFIDAVVRVAEEWARQTGWVP